MIGQLQGFRFGDERALRAMYDEHGALVFTYCARTVGSNRAADVTQDVFISAWRSRERFDPERGSFSGWLMTIAKRRCVDALRRSGRRPEFATDTAGEDGRSLTSGDVKTVERIADRMLLDEVISSLPSRAQRAVELAFFEQMTHPEIAASTGLPLGTVKSDIRRALLAMRDQLGGGDHG